MGARTFAIIGVGLLVLGVAQIVQFSSATDTFVLTSCLGHEYVFETGVGRGPLFHCWGCYAAVTGAALIFVSFAKRFGRLEHIRR